MKLLAITRFDLVMNAGRHRETNDVLGGIAPRAESRGHWGAPAAAAGALPEPVDLGEKPVQALEEVGKSGVDVDVRSDESGHEERHREGGQKVGAVGKEGQRGVVQVAHGVLRLLPPRLLR